MNDARMDLLPTPDAPSAARQALKAVLQREGVPVAVLGRLLLITSEIVTTALNRTASETRDPVQLELDVDSRRVRVAVVDRRPGRAATSGTTSGMSFVILDRLSDRWGLLREEDRSEAWSEVDLPVGDGRDLPV